MSFILLNINYHSDNDQAASTDWLQYLPAVLYWKQTDITCIFVDILHLQMLLLWLFSSVSLKQTFNHQLLIRPTCEIWLKKSIFPSGKNSLKLVK